MNLRKIRDFVAEVKIRLNRGISLMNEIKNVIYVTTALKILFSLDIKTAVILGIGVFIGFGVIGTLDMDIIHLYQAEAKLTTTKYNPVFKDWDKKIK